LIWEQLNLLLLVLVVVVERDKQQTAEVKLQAHLEATRCLDHLLPWEESQARQTERLALVVCKLIPVDLHLEQAQLVRLALLHL
jgi:hypothetical protein